MIARLRDHSAAPFSTRCDVCRKPWKAWKSDGYAPNGVEIIREERTELFVIRAGTKSLHYCGECVRALAERIPVALESETDAQMRDRLWHEKTAAVTAVPRERR